MKLFQLIVGATFGFNYTSLDNVENAFLNGRACASGFAYDQGSFTAKCVDLTVVQTGALLPTSNKADPYSCNIVANENCYYYYTAVAYYTTTCRCGGDGTGYCPYPGGTPLIDRTLSELKVLPQSRCHTMD